MSNSTPQELAEAASQPGTFNFLDRLRGRNYPTDDVAIYIDESNAYKLKVLEGKLADVTYATEMKKLEAEAKELAKLVLDSKYTFKLRAISSEDYDKIIEELDKTEPIEYDESISPLTGRKTREPLPNEARDNLFVAMLWSNFIEDIIAPDGSSTGKQSPEDITQIRVNMPIDGVRRVGETINKLRMTVEWMDGIHDEGFFPTP